MSRILNCLSLVAAFVVLVTAALGNGDADCVITDTSCPCAVKPSSGICLRHQGGNECLLGECNDGYKCDCFGFEQCSRSSYSIFTTAKDVVLSVDTPFSCHLTDNAGNCTVFEKFLETTNAADNAKSESTTSMKETDTKTFEVLKEIEDMSNDKIEVEKKVAELDQYAERVTEEEFDEIAKDVKIITEALKAAQIETVNLQNDVSEASEANIKVGKMRRVCRRKERKVAEKKTEKKAEAAKPENENKCERCDELKEEIKVIREERREAAKAAGEWTKKVQGAKNKCRQRRRNVKKIRLSAKEARTRCVERSEKIFARLRRQNANDA